MVCQNYPAATVVEPLRRLFEMLLTFIHIYIEDYVQMSRQIFAFLFVFLRDLLSEYQTESAPLTQCDTTDPGTIQARVF